MDHDRSPTHDRTPGQDPERRVVLRGSTLVSAPFTLAALICAAVSALSVTWVFAHDDSAEPSGWLTAIAFAIAALGLLIAARGCRVVVEEGRICDQVAWRTVWSAPAGEIVEVRVRRGPWRTFETEDAAGRRRVLLGAGPVQFPANLIPDSAQRDLGAIDMLKGYVRS